MSGTEPRVSVILIFLNGEDYIQEAISSVMAQTIDDFELLLCDDGSTDDSTRIALEWVSRHPNRIRYLQHEHHVNRGMSAARNLGIGAGRSEFIAFIDADDVWRPGKLAEQTALMDAHPEVGMLCGTVNYWSSWQGGQDVLVPTGHVLNRVVPPPEAALAISPLGEAAAPCPSDMLLRRDAVEIVHGFEERFTGLFEDQAFLAKLYLARPVLFTDAVWLDYRQHAQSCMARAKRDGRRSELRHDFLVWLENYINQLPEDPPRSVRAALSRNLRPYRRPVLHAATVFPGRVSGRIRKEFARARASLDRQRSVKATSGPT